MIVYAMDDFLSTIKLQLPLRSPHVLAKVSSFVVRYEHYFHSLRFRVHGYTYMACGAASCFRSSRFRVHVRNFVTYGARPAPVYHVFQSLAKLRRIRCAARFYLSQFPISFLQYYGLRFASDYNRSIVPEHSPDIASVYKQTVV